MYAIESENFNKELNGALAIAHLAGSVMQQYYDLDYQVSMKAGESAPAAAIFTEVDGKIDRFVQDYYKQNWRDDQLFTEETDPDDDWYKHSRIWIVDPIDGTMGYKKKTGSYGISVALIQEGRPVVGVIYAPARNLIAWAVADEGTYLNGKKVDLSTKSSINTILCSSNSIDSFPYQKALNTINPNNEFEIIATESVVVKALLILNSEGEIYPILPRTDENKSVPNFWDIAAADLLIHEAGGIVTDFSGEKYQYNIPEFRCIHGAIMGTSQGHKFALSKLRSLV
jgi:fructose-1,6-bisphosphatase/inositol monophosphatase family enzyme